MDCSQPGLRDQIRGTAELCEARYIGQLKRSIPIEIPSELNLCPDIQAPKRRIPAHFRSFKRDLESHIESISASADTLKHLTSVPLSEDIYISMSKVLRPAKYLNSTKSHQIPEDHEIPRGMDIDSHNPDNNDTLCIPRPNGKIKPSVFRTCLGLSSLQYEDAQVPEMAGET